MYAYHNMDPDRRDEIRVVALASEWREVLWILENALDYEPKTDRTAQLIAALKGQLN